MQQTAVKTSKGVPSNQNWSLSDVQKNYINANYMYEPIGTMQNKLSISYFVIQKHLDDHGLSATSFLKIKPAAKKVATATNINFFNIQDYTKTVSTI